MIYVDSSAALAHLLLEPRSPPASLWNGSLVSGQLLEYEVSNRIHAYGLGGSHADEAQAAAYQRGFNRDDGGRARTSPGAVPDPGRTLDRLHLATVDFLRTQGEPVELASYDNQLVGAARVLEIPIATL